MEHGGGRGAVGLGPGRRRTDAASVCLARPLALPRLRAVALVRARTSLRARGGGRGEARHWRPGCAARSRPHLRRRSAGAGPPARLAGLLRAGVAGAAARSLRARGRSGAGSATDGPALGACLRLLRAREWRRDLRGRAQARRERSAARSGRRAAARIATTRAGSCSSRVCRGKRAERRDELERARREGLRGDAARCHGRGLRGRARCGAPAGNAWRCGTHACNAASGSPYRETLGSACATGPLPSRPPAAYR